MKKISILFLLLISIIFSSEKENHSDLVKVEFQGQEALYQDGTNYLMFNFKIKDHWHIYWRNPGDSGLPTDIQIDSIPGFEIGEIMWQVPEKIPFDDLANYGYSDSVRITVPIKFIGDVAYDIKEHEQLELEKVKVGINWLVCKETCIGQDTSFTINLVVKNSKIKNPNNEESGFTNYIDKNYKFQKINAKAYNYKSDDALHISLPKKITSDYQFFPYDGGIYNHGETQKYIKNRVENSLILKFDPFKIETPKRLRGLLINQKDKTQAYEVDSPIIYNSQNSEED
jgi:thiol:disulfide interchange protein DsbD